MVAKPLLKASKTMIEDDEDYEIELLLNDKQADFIEILDEKLTYKGVKQACIIGGVGTGKTTIAALIIKKMFEELPRAKIQFACRSITQAKRTLTPELKTVWTEMLGMHEYDTKSGLGEYVLWRKPPDSFDRPFRQPDDYDNVISHVRGTVIEFCGYSQNPGVHRSRNDDALIIDEASEFKPEWRKVAINRVRANVGKFESNLHLLCVYFANPNYNPDGDWIWDLEELAIKDPDKYGFVHTKTSDNAYFLPDGYIEDKKRTLLDYEYRVEILGERVTRIKHPYYSSLDWQKHGVDDIEEPLFETGKDLTLSCDFNIEFTCCTAWQKSEKEHRCVSNIFIKQALDNKSMAQTLGFEIMKKYSVHDVGTIILTGDRNGTSRSSSSRKNIEGNYETEFSQIYDVLIDFGYQVVLMPLNYNPPKDEVHKLMHAIHAENGEYDYCFRYSTNFAKQTLISMTFTPIDLNLRKVKTSEQKKSLQQEHATHLGDTVDYYGLYCENGEYAGNYMNFETDFI